MFDSLFGNEEEASQPSSKKAATPSPPPSPRAPSPYVGLQNQGATCYLNSLLQSLHLTPEFRSAIYSIAEAILSIEPEDIDPPDHEIQKNQTKAKVIDEEKIEWYERMGFARDLIIKGLSLYPDNPTALVDFLLDPSIALMEREVPDLIEETNIEPLLGESDDLAWSSQQIKQKQREQREKHKEIHGGEIQEHIPTEKSTEVAEKKERKKNLLVELGRLFAEMELLDKKVVSTSSLTESFGWTHETYHQHDVHELLRILLDAIERAIDKYSSSLPPNTNGNNEGVSSPPQSPNSLTMSTGGISSKQTLQEMVSSLYRGSFINAITCSHCQKKSEHEETFSDVSVIVEGFDNLSTSLNAMTQEELLAGENAYECSECGQKREAVKRVRFRKLPPILILSLSRFQFDRKTGDRMKDCKSFGFPMKLDMSQYCELPTASKSSYELFSVVIHTGNQAGFGHYHAYINPQLPLAGKGRSEDGERKGWFDFNDSSVTKIDESKIQSQFGGKSECAYMLMYRNTETLNHRPSRLLLSQAPRLLKEIENKNKQLHEKRENYHQKQNEIVLNLYSEQFFEISTTAPLPSPPLLHINHIMDNDCFRIRKSKNNKETEKENLSSNLPNIRITLNNGDESRKEREHNTETGKEKEKEKEREHNTETEKQKQKAQEPERGKDRKMVQIRIDGRLPISRLVHHQEAAPFFARWITKATGPVLYVIKWKTSQEVSIVRSLSKTSDISFQEFFFSLEESHHLSLSANEPQSNNNQSNNKSSNNEVLTSPNKDQKGSSHHPSSTVGSDVLNDEDTAVSSRHCFHILCLDDHEVLVSSVPPNTLDEELERETDLEREREREYGADDYYSDYTPRTGSVGSRGSDTYRSEVGEMTLVIHNHLMDEEFFSDRWGGIQDEDVREREKQREREREKERERQIAYRFQNRTVSLDVGAFPDEAEYLNHDLMRPTGNRDNNSISKQKRKKLSIRQRTSSKRIEFECDEKERERDGGKQAERHEEGKENLEKGEKDEKERQAGHETQKKVEEEAHQNINNTNSNVEEQQQGDYDYYVEDEEVLREMIKRKLKTEIQQGHSFNSRKRIIHRFSNETTLFEVKQIILLDLLSSFDLLNPQTHQQSGNSHHGSLNNEYGDEEDPYHNSDSNSEFNDPEQILMRFCEETRLRRCFLGEKLSLISLEEEDKPLLFCGIGNDDELIIEFGPVPKEQTILLSFQQYHSSVSAPPHSSHLSLPQTQPQSSGVSKLDLNIKPTHLHSCVSTSSIHSKPNTLPRSPDQKIYYMDVPLSATILECKREIIRAVISEGENYSASSSASSSTTSSPRFSTSNSSTSAIHNSSSSTSIASIASFSSSSATGPQYLTSRIDTLVASYRLRLDNWDHSPGKFLMNEHYTLREEQILTPTFFWIEHAPLPKKGQITLTIFKMKDILFGFEAETTSTNPQNNSATNQSTTMGDSRGSGGSNNNPIVLTTSTLPYIYSPLSHLSSTLLLGEIETFIDSTLLSLKQTVVSSLTAMFSPCTATQIRVWKKDKILKFDHDTLKQNKINYDTSLVIQLLPIPEHFVSPPSSIPSSTPEISSSPGPSPALLSSSPSSPNSPISSPSSHNSIPSVMFYVQRRLSKQNTFTSPVFFHLSRNPHKPSKTNPAPNQSQQAQLQPKEKRGPGRSLTEDPQDLLKQMIDLLVEKFMIPEQYLIVYKYSPLLTRTASSTAFPSPPPSSSTSPPSSLYSSAASLSSFSLSSIASGTSCSLFSETENCQLVWPIQNELNVDQQSAPQISSTSVAQSSSSSSFTPHAVEPTTQQTIISTPTVNSTFVPPQPTDSASDTTTSENTVLSTQKSNQTETEREREREKERPRRTRNASIVAVGSQCEPDTDEPKQKRKKRQKAKRKEFALHDGETIVIKDRREDPNNEDDVKQWATSGSIRSSSVVSGFSSGASYAVPNRKKEYSLRIDV